MKKVLIIIGLFGIFNSCSKEYEKNFQITINKEITKDESIFINFGDSCNIKNTEVINLGGHGSRSFDYIRCLKCNYSYESNDSYYGKDQAVIKIIKMNNESFTYTINILIK